MGKESGKPKCPTYKHGDDLGRSLAWPGASLKQSRHPGDTSEGKTGRSLEFENGFQDMELESKLFSKHLLALLTGAWFPSPGNSQSSGRPVSQQGMWGVGYPS